MVDLSSGFSDYSFGENSLVLFIGLSLFWSFSLILLRKLFLEWKASDARVLHGSF